MCIWEICVSDVLLTLDKLSPTTGETAVHLTVYTTSVVTFWPNRLWFLLLLAGPPRQLSIRLEMLFKIYESLYHRAKDQTELFHYSRMKHFML